MTVSLAAASVESRASWVVAFVVLTVLSFTYGAPLIVVVALKPITATLDVPRAIPSLAASLVWFGTGSGGIAMGLGVFGEGEEDGDGGGGQGGARDVGPVDGAGGEGGGDDRQGGDEGGAGESFEELEEGTLAGGEAGVGTGAGEQVWH